MVSDVRERVRDLGSPLRFMLRRSSLVECVSVLHGTCLQSVENVSIRRYVSLFVAMFVKKSLVHILYHKELADARILKHILLKYMYLFKCPILGLLFGIIKQLLPSIDCKHQNC